MKVYFLSVILTAVFGGICEELLPESSSVRPHLKLVTGLCVLAVLVLPAKDLLVGIGELALSLDLGAVIEEERDTGEYEAIFEGSLSRYSADEIGRYLGELIETKFGLSEGTCRASAVLDDSGGLSRVVVCLSGMSILHDPYEIEVYVNELLGCPCDVAVE